MPVRTTGLTRIVVSVYSLSLLAALLRVQIAVLAKARAQKLVPAVSSRAPWPSRVRAPSAVRGKWHSGALTPLVRPNQDRVGAIKTSWCGSVAQYALLDGLNELVDRVAAAVRAKTNACVASR